MRYYFTLFTLVALISIGMAKINIEPKNDGPLIYGLLTPQCYDVLLNQLDFTHVVCIKFVISKALGYAIIGGSFLLKLPQIIKIISAGDVTGLTQSSFYMEVFVFQSNTVYNLLQGYPISTWGESIVILIQNIFLVILLWKYSKPTTSILSCIRDLILFLLSSAAMFYIPFNYQWTLATLPIPVSIASRIPQIFQNFKQRHTGQLAIITLLLNMGGSLARLFTTSQETGDIIQLSGYLISFILNFILVGQVFLYWSATNSALQKKRT